MPNQQCQGIESTRAHTRTHTRTHARARLTALCPGLPGWDGTRKVKPIWILLEQETVSGSGISWAICKSAPCSRQITMPAPHHSVFYRPDALPATQPTVSKHWRLESIMQPNKNWIRFHSFANCKKFWQHGLTDLVLKSGWNKLQLWHSANCKVV